jgi:hypothetical protein
MLRSLLNRLPPPWVCFALVGVLLVALTQFGISLVPAESRVSDEGAYVHGAESMLDGTYPDERRQGEGDYLWHGPGLSLVLVPLSAVGAPVEVLRLVSPLTLLAAGYLLFVMLRRHVAEPLALLAGLALCLYPPTLRLLPLLYVEPLSLLVGLGMLAALARALRERSLPWAVAAGLLFGFLAMVRPEYGYLALLSVVLAVAAAVIRRSASTRVLAVAAVSSLAVCVPWLAFTYAVTDRPLLFATAGGDSLYWMTSPHPGETGSWFAATQVRDLPELAPHRPLFARIDGLPQVQYDEELRDAALENIREDPALYAERLVLNLGRLLFQYPMSFETYDLGRVVLYLLPNLLLLAVLIASIAYIHRRRIRIPLPVTLILIFAFVNVVIHLPGSAYVRMLLLSVPAPLCLAALALQGRLGVARDDVVSVRAHS